MFKIFFTTTCFIGFILFLRSIFRNHISARLQYALWFLVAVKLLVFPMPNLEGNLSVWGLVSGLGREDSFTELSEEALAEAERNSYASETQAAEAAAGNLWAQEAQNEGTAAIGADTGKTSEYVAAEEGKLSEGEKRRLRTKLWWQSYIENILKVPGWIIAVWGAGCILCALYMAVYHVRLKAYLRGTRREVPRFGKEEAAKRETELPTETERQKKENAGKVFPVRRKFPAVYSVAGLPTPCLFGKSIYIPERLAEDIKLLPYILKHEMCHYFHGDSIWGALRVACVCLYWYHPMVWAAAYLSRQDCELACDEAAVRQMNGEERKRYGELLLQFALVKSSPVDCFSMTTAMSGNAKKLKQRLERIAGKKKNRVLSGGIVAALTLIGIYACITSGFVSPQKQWQSVQIREKEESIPLREESYEVSYRLSKDAASYGFYAEQYEYGELVSAQAWDCESLLAEEQSEKAVKRGTANIYRTIETEETTGACLKIAASYMVQDYMKADGPTSVFKVFSLELPENCAGNSFSFQAGKTLRHRFRMNEDIVLAADYYGSGRGEELPDGTTAYGHLQVPGSHVFSAAQYLARTEETLQNDRCVILLHLIVSDKPAGELEKQIEKIVRKRTEEAGGDSGEKSVLPGEFSEGIAETEGNGTGGYSNGQLMEMAENFYRREHGFAPAHVEIESENGNEVIIWLYDKDEFLNAENEIGGNAHTGDWYTVDRLTGKGENVLFEEIDLTQTASLTRPWSGKIEEMTVTDVRDETAFFELSAEPETGAESRLYLLGETANYRLYGAGDYRSMILEEKASVTEIAVPFITDGITLMVPGVQEADYDGDGEAELALKLLWGEGTGVWQEQLWMFDKEAGQMNAYEYHSGAYAEELLRRLSFTESENGKAIMLGGRQISPFLREGQGASYGELAINTSRVSFAFADGKIKLRTLMSCGSREGSVASAWGEGCLEAEVLYHGSRMAVESLYRGGGRFSIGDVESADLKDVKRTAEEAVKAFYAPRGIDIIDYNVDEWHLSKEREEMEMTLTVLEKTEDSYDFATVPFMREETGQWSLAGEIWVEK